MDISWKVPLNRLYFGFSKSKWINLNNLIATVHLYSWYPVSWEADNSPFHGSCYKSHKKPGISLQKINIYYILIIYFLKFLWKIFIHTRLDIWCFCLFVCGVCGCVCDVQVWVCTCGCVRVWMCGCMMCVCVCVCMGVHAVPSLTKTK